MIQSYDINGNLPLGIHKVSWQEFVDQFGYNNHRRQLIDGLYRALANLKQAGCTTAYVNGSFVTNTDIPGDFDVCWDISGVDFNKVDPVLLDFSNERLAQKIKYGGDLFANIEGVTDELYVLDFFQVDKNYNPKGIIEVDLDTLS